MPGSGANERGEAELGAPLVTPNYRGGADRRCECLSGDGQIGHRKNNTGQQKDEPRHTTDVARRTKIEHLSQRRGQIKCSITNCHRLGDLTEGECHVKDTKEGNINGVMLM